MDALRILFVLRMPGRLTVVDVGILLGFHPDSIRHLVKIGLLEAIGATEDVELFFDAVYIDNLRQNPKWLRKATNAVRAHHREKNQKQDANRKARGKEEKS